MKIITHLKTAHLYFLAPFPLFFDLASWSVLKSQPADIYELWVSEPSIPIPMVLVSTLAILLLGLVPRSKPLTLVSATNFKISVAGLVLMGIFFGLNDVGARTAIQVTLPIWLLCLLGCHSSAYDRVECLSLFIKARLFGVYYIFSYLCRY